MILHAHHPPVSTPAPSIRGPSRLLGNLRRALSHSREGARLEALRLNDCGYGYDTFGAHVDWVKRYEKLGRFLYERYFRVVSHGGHHIPAGSAILAANHSGTLPYDGLMIWLDVLRQTSPPRLARPIADQFVPRLPFISKWYARGGTVGGSRGNVRHLLETGELLLIFPEGTPGIGKPYSERYKLKGFRVGHVEFAIRHGAPVIPVAVIGAEEQMPLLVRLPLHPFGSPYLPVPATLIPLPVRYHIHYGAPIPLHREYPPEAADDPHVLSEAAQRVRAAVAGLIDNGLKTRRGIFK